MASFEDLSHLDKPDGPLRSFEGYGAIEESDIDEENDNDDDYVAEYIRYRRVEHTLKHDKKDDFVELINNFPSDELEDELGLILSYMFTYDSDKCAAAILAGETKIPNVTFWLLAKGTPLHEAAVWGACRITTLLLESGFSADVRCDFKVTSHFQGPVLKLVDSLPLGVLLSKVRFHLLRSNPKRTTSAVKLIIDLFGESIRYLETLRLLAENSRKVKQEFCNYLKQGKIIEVGALLLVARSQLLSSSTVEGEFRSILEKRDFMLDAKGTLSADLSITEKNNLTEIEETLVLLKIFDKIGDKLATLIRLHFSQTCPIYFQRLAAASLLEDAGFDVKTKHVCTSYSRAEELQHNISERGVDPRKPNFKTYALPSWVKEAPSSLSASAPASLVPQIMPLHHLLLKQSAPYALAAKRAFRR